MSEITDEDRFVDQMLRALKSQDVGTVEMVECNKVLLKLAIAGLNMLNAPMEENGEVGALQHVLAHRRPGQSFVCVDAGANVGKYCILLKLLAPDAEIHAFEPASVAYDLLLANLAARGAQDVRTQRLALGAQNGSATLFSDCSGSEVGSLYNRSALGHPDAASVQEDITITTLDSYAQAAGISHIDFLKLDVEGHEYAVLQGAQRLLSAGAIDVIQFEFGGWNVVSRVFFRDFWELLSKDYAIYRVMRDGLSPIDAYSEFEEIFFLQTLLAVRRESNAGAGGRI